MKAKDTNRADHRAIDEDQITDQTNDEVESTDILPPRFLQENENADEIAQISNHVENDRHGLKKNDGNSVEQIDKIAPGRGHVSNDVRRVSSAATRDRLLFFPSVAGYERESAHRSLM